MDFRSDPRRIECSTLLLVGDEDPITPPVFSEEIAAGLSRDNLTYVKYSKCGHGVIADKPDEAYAEIRRFVLSSYA